MVSGSGVACCIMQGSFRQNLALASAAP